MPIKKRKPATPVVRTNVTFPASLYRGLVRLANQRGISINALIVDLVRNSWSPVNSLDTHSPDVVE